jgi:hypothetical protein
VHSFRFRLMSGLTTAALAVGIAAGPASANTTSVSVPPDLGSITLQTNTCVQDPTVPNCENYAVALARYVASLANPQTLITLADAYADYAVTTGQTTVTNARTTVNNAIDRACYVVFGPGGCGSLPLPQ